MCSPSDRIPTGLCPSVRAGPISAFVNRNERLRLQICRNLSKAGTLRCDQRFETHAKTDLVWSWALPTLLLSSVLLILLMLLLLMVGRPPDHYAIPFLPLSRFSSKKPVGYWVLHSPSTPQQCEKKRQDDANEN